MYNGRFRLPRCLRTECEAASWLELWLPPAAYMSVCLSLVSIVCCQLEVSVEE